MLKVNIGTATCLPIHHTLKCWLHTQWQNTIRLINVLDIKHLCEWSQAVPLRERACAFQCLCKERWWWGGAVCLRVCVCAHVCVRFCKSVSLSLCVYLRVVLCVLTYADPNARRLSLEMLVSSVVVLAQECSFWTIFLLALPVVR